VKGDVQALLAPIGAQFVPAEHPALHPGRCARVEVDGRVIGFVGELHPKWRQAYELPHAPIVFELDAAALMQRPVPVFKPIAKQQSVWRDIAVVVGEKVTHSAVMTLIDPSPAGLIRSATLFDIYRPSEPNADFAAGERSLAVRLELLDDEATLTEERIEATVADLLTGLHDKLGARLRA
jgi:phenylalanyl-tRNA synthetase beta chain